MALADVTPAYVNVLTSYKYVLRTADSSEFDALKSMYAVYLMINTEYLPDQKFTHGLALLIAHHYAESGINTAVPGSSTGADDASSGPITNKSVGDMSIGYASVSASSANSSTLAWQQWLLTTVYGREFLALMKTFKPYPLVT
jgi:hypothetical protein